MKPDRQLQDEAIIWFAEQTRIRQSKVLAHLMDGDAVLDVIVHAYLSEYKKTLKNGMTISARCRLFLNQLRHINESMGAFIPKSVGFNHEIH